MRTLRLFFALVAVALSVLACGTNPTEPAIREQPFVGGDEPPPLRPPCDTTGGTPCHGTLPWY